MLFWSVFCKRTKNGQKRPKWCFWQSKLFFVRFQNTNLKNICASIVLKAESKRINEETFLWGVFFKNQKRSFPYLEFGPLWNKKKIKTLTRMRRAHTLKIWLWTSEIIPALWLVVLYWPIKKDFHTPPYCTVYNVHSSTYSYSILYTVLYSVWLMTLLQRSFMRRKTSSNRGKWSKILSNRAKQ